jgi:hypothetical protein
MTTTRKTSSPSSAPASKVPAQAPVKTTPKPAKTAPKAVAKTPATPTKAKPVATKPVATATVNEDKSKKPKLIRDSFTMPKSEYLQIDALKLSLAKQGRVTKKSELLRAGLMLLSKQTPGGLLACVESLTPVKTGRPKKR